MLVVEEGEAVGLSRVGGQGLLCWRHPTHPTLTLHTTHTQLPLPLPTLCTRAVLTRTEEHTFTTTTTTPIPTLTRSLLTWALTHCRRTTSTTLRSIHMEGAHQPQGPQL